MRSYACMRSSGVIQHSVHARFSIHMTCGAASSSCNRTTDVMGCKGRPFNRTTVYDGIKGLARLMALQRHMHGRMAQSGRPERGMIWAKVSRILREMDTKDRMPVGANNTFTTVLQKEGRNSVPLTIDSSHRTVSPATKSKRTRHWDHVRLSVRRTLDAL